MKKKEALEPLDRETLEQLTSEKLVDMVLRLQELVFKQNETIEKLKTYLARDSKTSSKPPSSDLLQKSEKAQEATEKTGRPGGQKGHKGKTRKGFGRIDRIEKLQLEQCRVCGGSHGGNSWWQSQIVAQLVAKPIEIVEYQRECGYCRDCGSKMCATLPQEVVAGQDLGAGLQAMLGWMSHYGHLSYKKQQEWLREIGGIEISTGTLQATTARLAKAVEPSISALKEWVKKQPQVHVDETPWVVAGVKEWLWTLSGKGFCLLHGGDTRSRQELEYLLGKSFQGVLISDDFAVYNGYPVAAQQKCLAHLLRHFRQVEKLKMPRQTELAQVFLGLLTEAFAEHRSYRQTGDRGVYDRWVLDFKERLRQAIETWKPQAGYAAGLLLTSLREKGHQWWYFLEHPEVAPDNNLAERCLRLGVTKRKVSGGSHSMAGFADTASLLTVIQSCRAQGRSILEFLRRALASGDGDRILSLIPTSDGFVNPAT
jgi:transposase